MSPILQTTALRACVPLLLGCLAAAPGATGEPLPYSKTSAAQGGELYQRYCTECHGRDGRAQMDVISDATNLTAPDEYYSGASREDIYRSIREGAGVAMPAFGSQLRDETAVWHLVNYIRSLWTPAQREAF